MISTYVGLTADRRVTPTDMDSCHIFNFLFGTKKATTELSRCFSSLNERATRRSRERRAEAEKQAEASGCAGGGGGSQPPPPSPLKQLQMKIANLASGKKTATAEQRKRSISCDAKSGTYRATLVSTFDGVGVRTETTTEKQRQDHDSEQESLVNSATTIANQDKQDPSMTQAQQTANEIITTTSQAQSKRQDQERDPVLVVMNQRQCKQQATLVHGTTTKYKQVVMYDDWSPLKTNADACNNVQLNATTGRLQDNGDCDEVASSDGHNQITYCHHSNSLDQHEHPSLISSAEVYKIVSEFGEPCARLRRVGSVSSDGTATMTTNHQADNIGTRRSNHRPSELQSAKSLESNDNNGCSHSETSRLADKRSVFVRSLVQSIEQSNWTSIQPIEPTGCLKSNKDDDDDDDDDTIQRQDFETAKTTQVDTQQQADLAPYHHHNRARGYKKPVTFVKPLPPKTPPKTNRAKCLNMQLSLNKPIKIQQLFQDEKFLKKFFNKLEPLDRCVAAQVCRLWRNILYANQNYWKDLINVIDCTQLRREHLVECIISTVQSAKLKQLGRQQVVADAAGTTCNRNQALRSSRTCSESQSDQAATDQSFTLDSIGMDRDQQLSTATSCFADIDQDDIWRIQELCNRYAAQRQLVIGGRQPTAASNELGQIGTGRSSDHTNANNEQAPPPPPPQQQQQHHQGSCMASKSSSIPSQISSTLSSVSISSLLLSPLSESSNRIECIREKLYTSLDNRGFDTVCLFGATDDDIEDLVTKMPHGAHKRIVAGRLNNCSLTDRGLELFVSTFDQIVELELSGCNEITNSIELQTLSNLKRLIITDCINIADGLAQKLIEILQQLDELTVQAYHLTDAFLDYLSLNSSTAHLIRLELPNCKEITNQTLVTIAKHFPHLRALSISGSTKVSFALILMQ